MYGMFAGVVAQFTTFGFLSLITNLVAHGDAASMANILEDSTKMTFWAGVIVGVTFSSGTYFLTFLFLYKCVRTDFAGIDTPGNFPNQETIENNSAMLNVL